MLFWSSGCLELRDRTLWLFESVLLPSYCDLRHFIKHSLSVLGCPSFPACLSPSSFGRNIIKNSFQLYGTASRKIGVFSEDGKPAKCLSLKTVGKRKLWNYCCSMFTFQKNNYMKYVSSYYPVRAYMLFWLRSFTFLTCPSTLFLGMTRYRLYRHGYVRFPICIHYKASVVLDFVLLAHSGTNWLLCYYQDI